MIFPWDCQPEVHVFDMEYNTSDMDFFLNRCNVKNETIKPPKQEIFSNARTRRYGTTFLTVFMEPSEINVTGINISVPTARAVGDLLNLNR